VIRIGKSPNVLKLTLMVGSVIAETVASNLGVGYLMIAASSRFDVPLVFAGLVVIAAMGVALFVLFAIMERRFTSWAYRN